MIVTGAGGVHDWIVRGVARVHEAAGGHPRNKPVPTATELANDGLIAPADNPCKYFSAAERTTADWLQANGVHGLRSVRERPSTAELPTPDAVFDHIGGLATMEFKSLEEASVNAVSQGIRRARRQSRILAIDGRSARVDRNTGEEGLKRAVRGYGHDVDQIVVVLGDGAAIGWQS